jgi:ABC-type polysaccharide/polyol phosphate transport system ATPase subunit
VGDAAIRFDGVWKSYRIYHQRSHTLKEKVLSRRTRYREFWALKDINLEVPEGSTLGIVGPNGSGKSTLLKTMARILTPNRGTVTVNGRMSSLLELGTGFHPDLTGRENLFLGGSLLGHSRRDVERLFDDIVDFAGIGRFIDMPVKNYSSGMYARLAFSLAISVDPEILLLDEVLSVGDESFQRRCFERMAEFREDGRTVVFVSHSLDAVQMLCTRGAWIEDGVIREVGDAPKVIASYVGKVDDDIAHDPHRPTSGRRSGTGEARCTEVVLLDAGGDPTETFRTGDRFTIRVTYRTQELPDELLCAVAVHRTENLAYVFGQNSCEAKASLVEKGTGVVELTIPWLPLLKGSYVISVALQDRGLTKTYDFHDREYPFVVVENPRLPLEAGFVHVPSEWTAWPLPSPSVGDPRPAASA